MINAVKLTLIEKGFSELKINAVAEKSNIDKSAIYRYFEDFKGLLENYIDKQDYWLEIMQQDSLENTVSINNLKKNIRKQIELLFDNVELQEIFRWELGDKSDITASISVKREIYSNSKLLSINDLLETPNVNLNFILAILIGGIYYNILFREKGSFYGVDLSKKNEKKEFLKSIDWLLDLIFSTNDRIRKIAINAKKIGLDNKKISELLDISIIQVEQLIE